LPPWQQGASLVHADRSRQLQKTGCVSLSYALQIMLVALREFFKKVGKP
jgi:hypothetical protein